MLVCKIGLMRGLASRLPEEAQDQVKLRIPIPASFPLTVGTGENVFCVTRFWF